VTELREARVHAGVDEAGLGPLLGPLTVGYSVLRWPQSRGRRNPSPWVRLRGAVARSVDGAPGRLVVTDSKVVFTRDPAGHRRLESTALAFLAQRRAARAIPQSGRELLACAPPASRPSAHVLARHPWYDDLPERLPMWVDEAELLGHAARLAAALGSSGLDVLDAGVRTVPEGELNDSYDSTDNKALTLWRKASGLFEHLWESHAGEGLALVVDRHGGRMRYDEHLVDLFPLTTVTTLRETPRDSEYVVREPRSDGRWMRIRFVQRADERHFAVALASCLAKYAREACMGAFNRYFGGLQPDLKPTAGYYNDALRWLEEARPALERAALDRRYVVRER